MLHGKTGHLSNGSLLLLTSLGVISRPKCVNFNLVLEVQFNDMLMMVNDGQCNTLAIADNCEPLLSNTHISKPFNHWYKACLPQE